MDISTELLKLTKIEARGAKLLANGYKANWATADVVATIEKLVGKHPDFKVTESGKVIWSSKSSTLEVVQDPFNGYFRVQSTIDGTYRGVNGEVIPTKIPGRPGGLKSSEFDALSHFKY